VSSVHHGNGTEEIVREYCKPHKLFFFSIHLYDKTNSTSSNATAANSYEFYPGGCAYLLAHAMRSLTLPFSCSTFLLLYLSLTLPFSYSTFLLLYLSLTLPFSYSTLLLLYLSLTIPPRAPQGVVPRTTWK
jgi:hypothetical protein